MLCVFSCQFFKNSLRLARHLSTRAYFLGAASLYMVYEWISSRRKKSKRASLIHEYDTDNVQVGLCGNNIRIMRHVASAIHFALMGNLLYDFNFATDTAKAAKLPVHQIQTRNKKIKTSKKNSVCTFCTTHAYGREKSQLELFDDLILSSKRPLTRGKKGQNSFRT